MLLCMIIYCLILIYMLSFAKTQWEVYTKQNLRTFCVAYGTHK